MIADSRESPAGFRATPFTPRRYLRNPHVQTIAGNLLPRTDTLPPPVAELVEVSPANGTHPASQVLCHCHWQPADLRRERPAVILVHGLEGSSNSQYVVGNANKLWRAGTSIIRMNMRNCGGTESLSPTLYHSGLSGDVDAVMRHFIAREGLTSVALVGYSMGGNLVMKLAGELGPDAPPQLRSVVGVSPAIDLSQSATALHRPSNRFYEQRFVRAMLKRYRRKVALFPRAFDRNRAYGIRSLRDFDERITSFYTGFRSAEDYYSKVRASRVVDRIAVPMLVLHALDDPFVVLTPETLAALHANPAVTFLQPTHGGHCAFLADPIDDDDGYWAESTLLRFILAQA